MQNKYEVIDGPVLCLNGEPLNNPDEDIYVMSEHFANAAYQFWGQLQDADALVKTQADRIKSLQSELGYYRCTYIAPRPAAALAQQDDPVNNPKHYQFAPGVEAIDVIEAILTTEQFRGYCIGNALKYRLRAGDKGDAQQDIDKSKWYQNRARTL